MAPGDSPWAEVNQSRLKHYNESIWLHGLLWLLVRAFPNGEVGTRSFFLQYRWQGLRDTVSPVGAGIVESTE